MHTKTKKKKRREKKVKKGKRRKEKKKAEKEWKGKNYTWLLSYTQKTKPSRKCIMPFAQKSHSFHTKKMSQLIYFALTKDVPIRDIIIKGWSTWTGFITILIFSWCIFLHIFLMSSLLLSGRGLLLVQKGSDESVLLHFWIFSGDVLF